MFNGTADSPTAQDRLITAVSSRTMPGLAARAAVNFKLRDWLFSRQWYWGEPFPIVHCPTHGAVGPAGGPVAGAAARAGGLQAAASRRPRRPAAAAAGAGHRLGEDHVPDRAAAPSEREINTMPQWAGSCWYYLRYLDPKNDKRLCRSGDREVLDGRPAARTPQAGGVDLYIGGAEHAVLHLLYARFWHKVLFDLGYV